jgi:hypothetical protein
MRYNSMKMTYHHILATVLAVAAMATAQAQSLNFYTDAQKAPYIAFSNDTVNLGYNNDFTTMAVTANCSYTIAGDASWLTYVKQGNGNVALFADYQFLNEPRTAKLTFTSGDGTFNRTLVVMQGANTSSSELKGDTKLNVTGTANENESGYGIEKSYDGTASTYYHSPWGSNTTFPVVLTYTLAAASHVDYVTYTPRQDGNSNGNFKSVTVEYATAADPNTWVTLTTTDLGGSSSPYSFTFGDNGIDGVTKVRFTVTSGQGGWASCAEMGFYQRNQDMSAAVSAYFSDKLCTSLKPEVTLATAKTISVPYLKQLAYFMLQGNYSTKYRVGEFKAYRPVGNLSAELKTATYNSYENPTGIYFTKGQKLVLFVEGIGSDPVSLKIKSFGEESYSGEGHPESSYSLSNGVNVITASNRGNGYISYYTLNYATAPKVKIHFAMANENGYFDLGRGDTDADWVKLLAGACSDIMDIRTPRLQVAAPVTTLRSKCPKKGVELAMIYDSLIYREREIMGLALFNREPANHQFARPVDSGMFADGIGAAAAFGSFGEWVNADNFGFWGMAHELGHVNQVRPGLKWVGCGETTNNIYSAWVEHKLGSGYHRLEDEVTGVNDYSGTRGGRFETYLQEGVCKGISWQLQDGPDYHGNSNETVSVNGEDADGNNTGNVSTTKRNYDHFVKVVPLYQLTLYTQEVGASKDAYGKVIEGIRTYNENGMTNGQLQVKFMRSFCDSTHINFLPFFEKAGMLRPIHSYIEDYSAGWLIISDKMISDLKTYIAAKGYAEAPAGLNYINGYNWKVFRDKGALAQATLNQGCSKLSNGRVQVDANVWKNAVGFETYSADGTLLRCTMFGLGAAQQSSRYTQVLWPSTTSEKAAYIMAVGYDGTRIKCYQP